MDLTFVTPRLATAGAISTPQDLQATIQAGITHIINTRAEFDDKQLFPSTPGPAQGAPAFTPGTHPSPTRGALAYLYIPTLDDGHPKPVLWFAQAITFALTDFADPRTRVLAHCAAGVNRGPSIIYAILRALGIPPGWARNIILARRPQAQLRYAPDADRAITHLGYPAQRAPATHNP